MAGNMAVGLIAGLLAGLLQLALTVPVASFLGVFLSPVPILWAGLSRGPLPAMIAGLIALLLVAGLRGPAFAAGLAVVDLLPGLIAIVLILTYRRQAQPGGRVRATTRRYLPWGTVLAIMTLLATAALLIAALSAPPPGVEFRAQVESLLDSLYGSQGRFGQLIAETIAPHAPGLVATTWVLRILFLGAIVQRVLVKRGAAKRPEADFGSISLPTVSLGLLVAAVITALILDGNAGYVAYNMAFVLALPHSYAGLTRVHALAGGVTSRIAGIGVLTLYYGLFIVLPEPVALATLVLGVIDHGRRLIGRPQNLRET